jgi:hypothetical protein
VTATEVNVTTTEVNKQTIRSLFQALNEHRVGDLPDHIAPEVTDHNKIIHGEADESRRSLRRLRPAARRVP